MKAKSNKKASHQLRHAPLASEIEKPVGKLRAPKAQKKEKEMPEADDNYDILSENDSKMLKQAKELSDDLFMDDGIVRGNENLSLNNDDSDEDVSDDEDEVKQFA